MTKTKWLFLSACIVIALLVAWYVVAGKNESVSNWKFGNVEKGELQIQVTATGTLEAVSTVQVGTQVSGTISVLNVDFNSKVKKGQVIAKLDTTLLRAALDDALSNQNRVRALENQTAAELKRMESLAQKELISKSEFEKVKADASVALANYKSSEAQVERAKINLRYATITAPIDGIVLSRAVDLGQTVAASFNTPTLFTIAGDLRQMQVKAAVDEADIGKIKVGQPTTFTVDAYPDTQFIGEVLQIRLEPKIEQNVVTYNVLIGVPNPALKLMPGMTASLSIIVEEKKDVWIVPSSALRFIPPDELLIDESVKKHTVDMNGKRFKKNTNRQENRGRIYILNGEKIQSIRVTTGLSDGSRTEISGKISDSLQVILGTDTEGDQKSKMGAKPFGLTNTAPRRRM